MPTNNKKYAREYVLKNKERVKEINRRSAKKHQAEIILRNKERRREVRILCIEKYGGKCTCCGENRFEFLAIDHIDGNGAKHRLETFGKKNTAGYTTHIWLKRNNYPPGFQILCHNCNLSRGFYGYCPHQG